MSHSAHQSRPPVYCPHRNRIHTAQSVARLHARYRRSYLQRRVRGDHRRGEVVEILIARPSASPGDS
jgi:hypothetical protein